jgi:hypothetical protein
MIKIWVNKINELFVFFFSVGVFVSFFSTLMLFLLDVSTLMVLLFFERQLPGMAVNFPLIFFFLSRLILSVLVSVDLFFFFSLPCGQKSVNLINYALRGDFSWVIFLFLFLLLLLLFAAGVIVS